METSFADEMNLSANNKHNFSRIKLVYMALGSGKEVVGIN